MTKEHRDIRPQAFKDLFQASSDNGEYVAWYLRTKNSAGWDLGDSGRGGSSRVIQSDEK